MTPRLSRMNAAIRKLHKGLGRMPTRKELIFELGDKTRGPLGRDLRRLQAAGAIRLHPRGTIAGELV